MFTQNWSSSKLSTSVCFLAATHFWEIPLTNCCFLCKFATSIFWSLLKAAIWCFVWCPVCQAGKRKNEQSDILCRRTTWLLAASHRCFWNGAIALWSFSVLIGNSSSVDMATILIAQANGEELKWDKHHKIQKDFLSNTNYFRFNMHRISSAHSKADKCFADSQNGCTL